MARYSDPGEKDRYQWGAAAAAAAAAAAPFLMATGWPRQLENLTCAHGGLRSCLEGGMGERWGVERRGREGQGA